MKTFNFRFLIMAAFLVTLALANSGCATLGKAFKAWLNGGDSDEIQVATPRFSDTDNLRVGTDRQYKRMNRRRLEEEAELRADAGSLWVMEGQGAYLFAQNQMRMVGDLLNIKIEGSPKSQLQTKARVISKLLERLENPPARGLASQGKPAAQGAQAQAGQNPQAGGPDEANPAGAADGAAQAAGKPEAPFSVQMVPTRIVEQLKDGSYRVRGIQPFMIGKREYKVIVTGIVRPEDFDDGGIDAGKLLDSQFDIVSSRKGAAL